MAADPENGVPETEPDKASGNLASYSSRRDALGMFLDWAQGEIDDAHTLSLSWMGSPEKAEAVVQAGFTRLWKESRRVPRDFSRREWLMRVTLEECKTATAEIPEDSRQWPVFMPQTAAKLVTEDKEVLVLHDLIGFSSAEVAKILDISLGSARSRLNRARRGAAGLDLDPSEPIPTQQPDTIAPFFVRNRLSALLDGRLQEEARKELESAISGSAVLKREHTVLLNLVKHLQALSKPAPVGFLLQMEEGLRKRGSAPGPGWRATPSGIWGLVAAGAIVGVVLWGRGEPITTRTIQRIPSVPVAETVLPAAAETVKPLAEVADDVDKDAGTPVEPSLPETDDGSTATDDEGQTDETTDEQTPSAVSSTDAKAENSLADTITKVQEAANAQTSSVESTDVRSEDGAPTEAVAEDGEPTPTDEPSGFVVPGLVGFRWMVMNPDSLSGLANLARNHGGNIEEVGRETFSDRILSMEDNFARLILSVPSAERDAVRQELVAMGGLSSDVPISVKSDPEEGKALFFVEVTYAQ